MCFNPPFNMNKNVSWEMEEFHTICNAVGGRALCQHHSPDRLCKVAKPYSSDVLLSKSTQKREKITREYDHGGTGIIATL